MDKEKTYLEIYNTCSDTNDVLHVVIERLKSLDTYDCDLIMDRVEIDKYKGLLGDWIKTEDLKKIIEELTNAL